MADVMNFAAYALADALGITLRTLDGSKFTGEGQKSMSLDGVELNLVLKVAASKKMTDGIAVMVRVRGNLAVLVIAHGRDSGYGFLDESVSAHLINLAKTDRLDGWFDRNHADTVASLYLKLGKARVRSFNKNKDNTWAQAL